MKIVIVSGGTMFGPFSNVTDTDVWLETHNANPGGEEIKIFSMWDGDVEPATSDKAHSCGVLLGRNRSLENRVRDQRRENPVSATGPS